MSSECAESAQVFGALCYAVWSQALDSYERSVASNPMPKTILHCPSALQQLLVSSSQTRSKAAKSLVEAVAQDLGRGDELLPEEIAFYGEFVKGIACTCYPDFLPWVEDNAESAGPAQPLPAGLRKQLQSMGQTVLSRLMGAALAMRAFLDTALMKLLRHTLDLVEGTPLPPDVPKGTELESGDGLQWLQRIKILEITASRRYCVQNETNTSYSAFVTSAQNAPAQVSAALSVVHQILHCPFFVLSHRSSIQDGLRATLSHVEFDVAVTSLISRITTQLSYAVLRKRFVQSREEGKFSDSDAMLRFYALPAKSDFQDSTVTVTGLPLLLQSYSLLHIVLGDNTLSTPLSVRLKAPYAAQCHLPCDVAIVVAELARLCSLAHVFDHTSVLKASQPLITALYAIEPTSDSLAKIYHLCTHTPLPLVGMESGRFHEHVTSETTFSWVDYVAYRLHNPSVSLASTLEQIARGVKASSFPLSLATRACLLQAFFAQSPDSLLLRPVEPSPTHEDDIEESSLFFRAAPRTLSILAGEVTALYGSDAEHAASKQGFLILATIEAWTRRCLKLQRDRCVRVENSCEAVTTHILPTLLDLAAHTNRTLADEARNVLAMLVRALNSMTSQENSPLVALLQSTRMSSVVARVRNCREALHLRHLKGNEPAALDVADASTAENSDAAGIVQRILRNSSMSSILDEAIEEEIIIPVPFSRTALERILMLLPYTGVRPLLHTETGSPAEAMRNWLIPTLLATLADGNLLSPASRLLICILKMTLPPAPDQDSGDRGHDEGVVFPSVEAWLSSWLPQIVTGTILPSRHVTWVAAAKQLRTALLSTAGVIDQLLSSQELSTIHMGPQILRTFDLLAATFQYFRTQNPSNTLQIDEAYLAFTVRARTLGLLPSASRDTTQASNRHDSSLADALSVVLGRGNAEPNQLADLLLHPSLMIRTSTWSLISGGIALSEAPSSLEIQAVILALPHLVYSSDGIPQSISQSICRFIQRCAVSATYGRRSYLQHRRTIAAASLTHPTSQLAPASVVELWCFLIRFITFVVAECLLQENVDQRNLPGTAVEATKRKLVHLLQFGLDSLSFIAQAEAVVTSLRQCQEYMAELATSEGAAGLVTFFSYEPTNVLNPSIPSPSTSFSSMHLSNLVGRVFSPVVISAAFSMPLRHPWEKLAASTMETLNQPFMKNLLSILLAIGRFNSNPSSSHTQGPEAAPVLSLLLPRDGSMGVSSRITHEIANAIHTRPLKAMTQIAAGLRYAFIISNYSNNLSEDPLSDASISDWQCVFDALTKDLVGSKGVHQELQPFCLKTADIAGLEECSTFSQISFGPLDAPGCAQLQNDDGKPVTHPIRIPGPLVHLACLLSLFDAGLACLAPALAVRLHGRTPLPTLNPMAVPPNVRLSAAMRGLFVSMALLRNALLGIPWSKLLSQDCATASESLNLEGLGFIPTLVRALSFAVTDRVLASAELLLKLNGREDPSTRIHTASIPLELSRSSSPWLMRMLKPFIGTDSFAELLCAELGISVDLQDLTVDVDCRGHLYVLDSTQMESPEHEAKTAQTPQTNHDRIAASANWLMTRELCLIISEWLADPALLCSRSVLRIPISVHAKPTFGDDAYTPSGKLEAPPQDPGLLSPLCLARGGITIIRLLLTTKHMGVHSSAQRALEKVCSTLVSSNAQAQHAGAYRGTTRDLVGSWVDYVFECVRKSADPTDTSWIRRGAGLPFLLIALLKSSLLSQKSGYRSSLQDIMPANETSKSRGHSSIHGSTKSLQSQGKVFVNRSVETLLAIYSEFEDSGCDATETSHDDSWKPRVLVFNLLRAILRTRQISALLSPAHLASILTLTTRGIVDSNWNIRNVAVLAFAALSSRMLNLSLPDSAFLSASVDRSLVRPDLLFIPSPEILMNSEISGIVPKLASHYMTQVSPYSHATSSLTAVQLFSSYPLSMLDTVVAALRQQGSRARESHTGSSLMPILIVLASLADDMSCGSDQASYAPYEEKSGTILPCFEDPSGTRTDLTQESLRQPLFLLSHLGPSILPILAHENDHLRRTAARAIVALTPAAPTFRVHLAIDAIRSLTHETTRKNWNKCSGLQYLAILALEKAVADAHELQVTQLSRLASVGIDMTTDLAKLSSSPAWICVHMLRISSLIATCIAKSGKRCEIYPQLHSSLHQFALDVLQQTMVAGDPSSRYPTLMSFGYEALLVSAVHVTTSILGLDMLACRRSYDTCTVSAPFITNLILDAKHPDCAVRYFTTLTAVAQLALDTLPEQRVSEVGQELVRLTTHILADSPQLKGHVRLCFGSKVRLMTTLCSMLDNEIRSVAFSQALQQWWISVASYASSRHENSEIVHWGLHLLALNVKSAVCQLLQSPCAFDAVKGLLNVADWFDKCISTALRQQHHDHLRHTAINALLSSALPLLLYHTTYLCQACNANEHASSSLLEATTKLHLIVLRSFEHLVFAGTSDMNESIRSAALIALDFTVSRLSMVSHYNTAQSDTLMKYLRAIPVDTSLPSISMNINYSPVATHAAMKAVNTLWQLRDQEILSHVRKLLASTACRLAATIEAQEERSNIESPAPDEDEAQDEESSDGADGSAPLGAAVYCTETAFDSVAIADYVRASLHSLIGQDK